MGGVDVSLSHPPVGLGFSDRYYAQVSRRCDDGRAPLATFEVVACGERAQHELAISRSRPRQLLPLWRETSTEVGA